MTRPGLLIFAGSATLLVVVAAAKHFWGTGSTGVEAAPSQVSTGGHTPESITEQRSSAAGWIAKPDLGTDRDRPGTSDRSALGRGSTGPEARTADSHAEVPGTGGSATVLSGGSRAGSFVGTGRGIGSDATGALNVQTSVPAAALPSDLGNPLTSGSHPVGGQQGPVVQEAHNQPAVQAGDSSKSDNPDDQGPVLSIPFDNSGLPDKGDTGPIAEQGITFDSHGATFPTDAQFAIPDAGNLGTAEAGTISFCLRPQWGGDETATDASLVNLHTNTFENRLQIAKNGQYLRFLMADNTGRESGAGLNISGWQAGQSHLVTASWGQALSSLYVDGQLVGSQTYQGEVQIPPGTPMYIGSDVAGGNPGARAALSDFQVYNRVLPADAVANLWTNCE